MYSNNFQYLLIDVERSQSSITLFHYLAVGDDKTQSALSEDKMLFQRSQHSSMINGLHGRYQVYGPVVR